jgi:hypothetical protein
MSTCVICLRSAQVLVIDLFYCAGCDIFFKLCCNCHSSMYIHSIFDHNLLNNENWLDLLNNENWLDVEGINYELLNNLKKIYPSQFIDNNFHLGEVATHLNSDTDIQSSDIISMILDYCNCNCNCNCVIGANLRDFINKLFANTKLLQVSLQNHWYCICGNYTKSLCLKDDCKQILNYKPS